MCQFAFSVGKWTLCQKGPSAIYVWWTGGGENTAAKFSTKEKGKWFLRRGEKTFQVEVARCRGEWKFDCEEFSPVPANGGSWEQPGSAEGTPAKDDTRFNLGDTQFSLSSKEILVELSGHVAIRMPADRAVFRVERSGTFRDF